jgi:parvulin-like peptidyl-prolyl isomerase
LRKRTSNRWIPVAVFGALFAALFAIVGVADGIGHPSVPSDAVAVVEDAPNGTISKADFDAALAQAAGQQGLPKPPPPDDPQYETFRDQAMSSVLLSRWIGGEASERGITISDTEITNQLKEIADQQFGGQEKFQQYLKEVGFSPEQARREVENSLITEELQKDVVPEQPDVSEEEISNYYEANKSQFSQPETRDVRQIVNADQAKVEEARALLEEDDSPENWDKVAAKYSTEKATAENGGLREGVAEGQGEPAIDSQIYAAAEGALIGPIKGEKAYYLIQVETITPETTTPLEKVASQVRQQLAQGLQQDVANEFQVKFVDKWTERSFCADDYVTDRCANFTPPDTCTGDDPGEQGDLEETGCDTLVPPIAPVPPGSAAAFPGQPAQGPPQRPCAFEDPDADPPVVCNWPTAPAGGAQAPAVLGPGGAPQLPPGAAPQGAPPPQPSP